jgi:CHAT domain-containing protein/tetratricopeptide (TPR) repeat protein
LCLGFTSIAYCQPVVSDAEQYRAIVSAISRRDYTEAIAQGRMLIDRHTNRYEQVYLRIIQAAKSAGQLDQAKAAFESLLQTEPPNPRVYYVIGLIHSEQRDYATAIEYYKKCFSGEPEFPLALIALVDAYRADKRLDEAESYIKSLAQGRPNSAVVHLGAGYYYSKSDQIDEAAREIDIALSLNSKMPTYCYYKGLSLFIPGRRRDSLDAIATCLPAVRAEMDEEYQQAFLNIIATAKFELGSYSEAVRLFNQALEIARVIGDKGYEEVSHAYLALVSEMQGDYSQALFGYQQAFEIAKDSGHPSSIINLRRYPRRMGLIYYSLGDLPSALQHFHSGLELTIKANDADTEAVYQSCIGDVLVAQNNLAGAIVRYRRAVEINEKSRNPRLQNFVHDVLSSIYLRTGEYQRAKEVIERGLKLARELPSFEKELILLNRSGELHLRLNEAEQAINAYQGSLQVALSKTSPSHAWTACAGLALAYERLGRLDRAREYYQLAIEIMEKVRTNLGGEEERAGFFQDKVRVYKDLVAVLMRLQVRDSAEGFEAEAFHVAERGRARAFLDSLAEARVNGSQNQDEAFAKRLEEIEARISQLTARLIAEKSREPAKWDKERIKGVEAARDKADLERQDWLRQARLRSPHYARLKYPQPVRLADIQKTLGEDVLLLSYSLDEKESVLFAVARNGFQVRSFGGAAAISGSVDKLVGAIANNNSRSMSEYRRQAVRLYRELIEPVSGMLAGKKELIIVADGALHRLPFEVLLPQEALKLTQPDYKKLPYLVRDYAISRAPSASVLAVLGDYRREAVAPQKAFLSFADPVYGEDELERDSNLALVTRGAWEEGKPLKFDRLINSGLEAVEIARLFPAGQADLFLGADASEENVKKPGRLGQYRMIHFAAHGLLNQNRPRFSGIVLSLPGAKDRKQSVKERDRDAGREAEREDGILQAYEIFNLKLNADLVVLSACETGLGKEVNGEGLISLMRAFIYAGTPSVVVSLWNVDDRKSRDLMIQFYRNLKDGMSKARALQEAQKKLIGESGSPYFWAPFILVGRSN